MCVCVCFEIEKLKNQIQGKPLEPQQLQRLLQGQRRAAQRSAAQRRLFGASGGRH